MTRETSTGEAPVDALAIPEDLTAELLELSAEIDGIQQKYDAACEKRLSLKHQIAEIADRMTDILREVRGTPLLHQKPDSADDGQKPLLMSEAGPLLVWRGEDGGEQSAASVICDDEGCILRYCVRPVSDGGFTIIDTPVKLLGEGGPVAFDTSAEARDYCESLEGEERAADSNIVDEEVEEEDED